MESESHRELEMVGMNGLREARFGLYLNFTNPTVNTIEVLTSSISP